ncbi:MAG: type III restriction endonuclease subunit R [Epsilonproteobacteria bacterium]|nr:MAG: type III restriction endonuclease subunit R [Campylobacterota bacterium]
MSSQTINAISNRLSLRTPQRESLEILATLIKELELSKDADLATEMAKVASIYPTFQEFEREFPSVCFALATGVGKTRLMGAFIVYLMREKGIKNFFVLAPNLTIYNKLMEDFGEPSHSKYVFKGISEFVSSPPTIITGENYQYQGSLFDDKDGVHINVFNISKINADTRGGKAPKIKRLSEYLGQSYFEYLSNLDDLVILMDESHHYRADRGMGVINELKPILGLELTATPQVESGTKTIKFKNVVYEYSLSKAITDGYVKEPSVATRKNFDASQYRDDPARLDQIKIEDGVRLHEDTKVALDIYARDTKTQRVKPFILIVSKDTDHAREIKNLIQSDRFFNGRYADKVIEVHSNQKGDEKDENIAELVSLEDPANTTEIVIHVNMLKEGWDVTNLYTIVPLRTAASMTLREQTIGRGLRLPYGKRTGEEKVDRLTIVSHDKFQEIIDEANKPNSIIKQENIIEITDQGLEKEKEVVTAPNKIEEKFEEEAKVIETLATLEEKVTATAVLDAKKVILDVIQKPSSTVKRAKDLHSSEVKAIAIEKIRQNPSLKQQLPEFQAEIIKQAEEVYESLVEEFISNIIEIPRITIAPSEEVVAGFNDFDLDVSNINYQPVAEEILVQKLRTNEQSTVTGQGRISIDKPENVIVSELMNFPEVDYDSQTELLFKLVSQVIHKFNTVLDDENNVMNVIQYYSRDIAKAIYAQMLDNHYCEAPTFEQVSVKPFVAIEPHNVTKYKEDDVHDLRDTIEPTSDIPKKIFSGFTKACHNLYKFDSKTEKDFGIILEQDRKVLKWLRPAHNQFNILWGRSRKQYEPDFIVETEDTIYMVETKAERDIGTNEVQEKKLAAIEYCEHASKYSEANDGKAWKYMIVPHTQVKASNDLSYFTNRFIEN